MSVPRGAGAAWRVVVVGALLVAAAVVALGCRGRVDGRRRVIDERLLLTLEEATAWQHRADAHLADGDVTQAIHDVQQVLAISFPADAVEGEEARLDAHARLAKLHLSAGDEAAALEDVARGQKEGTRDSFYRAHVETVLGEILEARGKRLETSDGDGAKAARRDALAAYARSIEINKRVQAALLREPSP